MEVKDKTKNDIDARLKSIHSDLTKVAYLEAAVARPDLTPDVKRYIDSLLVVLYESRGMYDKAAKAMSNRAGMDVTYKAKIEAYLRAAELYAKAGRIDEAEDMFTRAVREANTEQKNQIMATRKTTYLSSARNLEAKAKRAAAVGFYEKLLKMKLEPAEKEEVKTKLMNIYKSMGKFKEAELLRGI